MLLNVYEVGSVKCGECTMGANGGGRGGIKTTADSNSTYYHIISCAA